MTTMQITQFVIDLCIVYYATYQLFSHRESLFQTPPPCSLFLADGNLLTL